jgi:hypothetical protein
MNFYNLEESQLIYIEKMENMNNQLTYPKMIKCIEMQYKLLNNQEKLKLFKNYLNSLFKKEINSSLQLLFIPAMNISDLILYLNMLGDLVCMNTLCLS